MIDEKKITKASKDFCKSLEAERKAIQQAELDKGAQFACTFIRPEVAFKAGINWFLDNLWHDASEEPKENHDILIESLNGTYTEYAAYRHNSAQLWSEFVDRSHTTRWFYINDLLKGGK